MKIFDKISKVFFAFLCFIVIVGMILLSVRNYITPAVEYTLLGRVGQIKKTNYFNGTVEAKSEAVIEVKAAQDMMISNINIKNGQIVPKNEMLFTIDTDSSSLGKQDVYDELNDTLYNINTEINNLIKNLEKKLNREIKNIDDVNLNDGIAIYAPTSGKIKNLAIKEGEKVTGGFIAKVTDDTALKIAFKMTESEYASLAVNQEVLLSFSGYEGYYKGKIDSINPNAEANDDKLSFVHKGTVVAENPGLIYPGVNVSISTQKNNQPVGTLTYAGVVASYDQESEVTTALYTDYNRTVYATKVHVVEGEVIDKGQLIATLGGEDVINELESDIKRIKDKIKEANKVQKNMQALYNDVILCNTDNEIIIDNSGNWSIPKKVYIDYVTDTSIVKKDEVILKYHVYDNNSLQINAQVDKQMYNTIKVTGNKIYYGNTFDNLKTTAVVIDEEEFDNYYDISFQYQKTDEDKLRLNDKVIFSVEISEKQTNVVPKTAIVPIGKIDVGASCYIYIIKTEDSILGKVDVLEQVRGNIVAVGDENVSIEFQDNLFFMDDVYIVNYINSTLKDGMRVKTR